MEPKQRVHNELEAIVLIKESFKKGNEDRYFDCKFFNHDEDYLFTSYTYYHDFFLVYPDGSKKEISI